MTRTPQQVNPYLLLTSLTEALDAVPAEERHGIWTSDGQRILTRVTSPQADGADAVGVVAGPEVAAVLVLPGATTHNAHSEQAHLITRGGQEYLLQRDPASGRQIGATPAGLGLGGRLVWTGRRVLELPSQAPIPDLAAVRQRAIAAAALDTLVHTEPAHAASCAEDLSAEAYYTMVALGEMRFGLSAPNWIEVHQQALRQARAIADIEGHPTALSRYLSWCDAPMWANHVDETTPTLQQAHDKLAELVADGTLTTRDEQRLTRVYLSETNPT